MLKHNVSDPFSKRKKDLPSKEIITVSEAGRLGGNATLRNKGSAFFQRIGKKGGLQTAKLYKHLLKKRGRLGGRPHLQTLDNYMRE